MMAKRYGLWHCCLVRVTNILKENAAFTFTTLKIEVSSSFKNM
jgi:hypothetical protein